MYIFFCLFLPFCLCAMKFGWLSASSGWPRRLCAFSSPFLVCWGGGVSFVAPRAQLDRVGGSRWGWVLQIKCRAIHTNVSLNGSVMHFVCPRLACRARYLPLGSLAHGLLAGHICLMGTPFSRIWRKCSCEATLGVMWRTAGAVGERSPRP